MSYGFSMNWKDKSGTRHGLSVSGYDTPETAKKACERIARKDGWTPRRWWQWWRWDEHLEPREATMRNLYIALWVSNALIASLVSTIVVLLLAGPR